MEKGCAKQIIKKKAFKFLIKLYNKETKFNYSSSSKIKISSQTKTKGVAYTKLAHYFNNITETGFKSFNTISATIYSHYPEILNVFDNRSTNSSTESFNAKIKRSELLKEM